LNVTLAQEIPETKYMYKDMKLYGGKLTVCVILCLAQVTLPAFESKHGQGGLGLGT
jgi:hypothetical protein